MAFRYLAGSALAAVTLAAQLAAAQSFTPLGIPSGDGQSLALGISADGSTIVGIAGAPGGSSHAARWSPTGTYANLEATQALAASSGGSVVVGFNFATGPVKWTAGSTTPIPVPDLPDAVLVLDGAARGVSADGTKIAGGETYATSFPPVSTTTQAFIWTAADGTKPLDGPDGGFAMSTANAISSDGSTVVGQGYLIDTSITHDSEPFSWHAGTGKVSLGRLLTLPGVNQGWATGVDADGGVIVGGATSDNTIGMPDVDFLPPREAFRWDSIHHIQGLGDLAGGAFSSLAYAVSGDGTVVVGSGTTADGETAFRWTQAGGMVSVGDYLAGLGVEPGTWHLQNASGISGDGKTLVGYGIDPDGNKQAWLAYAPPHGNGGLISIDEYVNSLRPVAAALGTGAALAGQSARTAAQVARDYGCAGSGSTCLYGVDGAQVGPEGVLLDPDFGVIRSFDGSLRGGVGISASAGGTDIAGGSERSGFAGLQGFLAYDPSGAGLQLLAGFSAGFLSVRTSRSYLDGATLEPATGQASGDAESAALRLGWHVPMSDTVSFTPFLGFDATRAALAGYTETSPGPFAATFAPRASDREEVSVGAEVRVEADPRTLVTASLAWRHRLAGNAAPLVASVPGVLSTGLPGAAGATDAAELELGVTRNLTATAVLSASLEAGLSPSGASTGIRAGFSYGF